MADTKLSALTELGATPAVGDEFYVRDVSEAASAESKRITYANMVPASTAKMETGTYTGDGATSQVISTSDSTIVVKFVFVVPQGSPNDSFFTTDNMVDDNANGLCVSLFGSPTDNVDYSNNRIIAVGTGSFTVDDNGSDLHPNTNSQVYNYTVIGI